MENDFFLNAGIAPLLHFDPSMPTWQSTPVSSSSPDCFWEKSTDQTTSHFDSAMSSMVNSPVASNVSNDSFAIRELIGKLGTIGSRHATPEAKRVPDAVPDFAADPGFAARAARFSCFGSRSFNGRGGAGSVPDPILSRVSSSPSLKELANSNDDHSTLFEQVNQTAATPNPRKRKAANSKGKAKVNEVTEKANAKRGKSSEDEKTKTEEEVKESPKPPEPPKDYIHVRARRGQATDSHSLAERVRREKISERMKLLQDLVPGCNKVTGKALMLDEIINYVQSLQRQVEFLSMKLSSVNTRLDGNIDPPMSKDVFQATNNSMSHPIFPLDSSAQAIFGHQNQPLHCSIDALDSSLCHLNGFTDLVSQYQAFGEDDLQSIVQMGFGANVPSRDTSSLQPQSIHGSNQASHMKIEL